jgi:hypothetical protein
MRKKKQKRQKNTFFWLCAGVQEGLQMELALLGSVAQISRNRAGITRETTA